ncbi:MAG: bifunctional phosphoglucose/phosphomannose isomerase [bacterium]
MHDVILNQPEQITHSLEINRDVKIGGHFDSIILCGMGGSGHPGDLLNALDLPKVPLYVHRNYDLPVDYLAHMGLKKPLVITSSYSGNTEESLTGYQAAKKAGIPILASASGGTLQKWAKRDNVPLCLIDFPGMQPRHTLFAAFTGIVTALANSRLAENSANNLKRTADMLTKTIPGLEAPARKLASKFKGKTPLFYSSDTLGFAAKNFKIQTNENAKTPAFWNTLPELNHNELASFSHPRGKFHTLIIRDDNDHPRIKARMDVTAELYEKWGTGVTIFDAKGNTLLEKIFSSVIFGLWTSYYLALEYNIDPIPIDGVEDFKTRLKDITLPFSPKYV